MKLKFNVTGMTCAACSARVEKVTNAVNGVEKAEVNLLAGTMAVEAAEAAVAQQIIHEIEKAGYGAALAGEKQKKEEAAAVRKQNEAANNSDGARHYVLA